MSADPFSPAVLEEGRWVHHGMVQVWEPAPHIRLLRAVLTERYAEPVWFRSPHLWDDSELTCRRRRMALVAEAYGTRDDVEVA